MAETTQTHTADLEPGSLITQDGQMQWAGILFGPGTPYTIEKAGLSGWEDLPEYDSSDAERPTGHGSWSGARYAKSRKVGGTLWMVPERGASLATVRALRQALTLGAQERWLAVRLHGEILAVRARISQRIVPADRVYATQGAAKASVQWLATDPRRYLVDEQSAVVSAPEPESGLTWPLVWPLSWGTASRTGDASADNDGSAPTHPVITFRGPCGTPSVTERLSRRRLRYGIDLTAGDELVVDTAAGTVTLNGTASRRHTATADSGPEELFTFEPGRAELSFRPDTAAAGASMSVRWRSAEW
ncbi:phage distal tail protein [Streptomyces sp. 4.24]|uniref:phage distal tail protein n=1 Tax=Streptomyces tritrimontium TaxID=3406573 RepID=UPI003BB6C3E5